MKHIICLFILVFVTQAYSQGLTTQGQLIVNSRGEEVLLKGMGPGGWMLMEGYMNQSAGIAGTQHEFEERLVELMGQEKTDQFFETWRANHFTKRDVDSLAKWGFNSIRLPMHYNLFTLPIEEEAVAGEHTWLETGFTMVDDLLGWCEENEMYLILDLHAAPGGQGYNADISDYDVDKPSLWESEANQDKTVALWTKLAERYKDEAWIGGYDLINEPNWELPGGTLLRSVYERITEGIRSVGDEHIIFIEGNWFANDHTGLTPPWDDNFVYSFHKYWSKNDANDLDWILPLREQHNVPLWMGESGENSNTWFTEAISLFEDNNIGWAWWTMRKVETINSPYSITLNDGYQDVLDYWKGEGEKPTEEEAFSAMMKLADNLLVDNNFFHPDVVDAMIRQIETDETIPFKNHKIPGVIHMSDYDLGKNGFAYYDVDAANYQLSTGSFQAWNSGWTYRNDGVDIEKNEDDVNSNGYHIGFVHKGEWMNFTTAISEEGSYTLNIRTASEESGGRYHLSLDGEAITTSQTSAATGGWTDFINNEITGIGLTTGTHVLTLHIDNDIPVNISSIEFEKSGELSSIPFTALTGETSNNEESLEITLSEEINLETLASASGSFIVSASGETVSVSEIGVSEDKSRTLMLKLNSTLNFEDEITVSYTGTEITSSTGNTLETFSHISIVNLLPKRFVIPGKIEAEDFDVQLGFQTENSSDDGGGLNLGFAHLGDYADYQVFVTGEEREFKVDLRIAGLSDEGNFGFYLVEGQTEQELFTIQSSPTGGWQTWETISATTTLPAGSHILRLKITDHGEFNLNWFEFSEAILGTNLEFDQVLIYPNPSSGKIWLREGTFVSYSILSLAGAKLKEGLIPETQEIDLRDLKVATYILKLVSQDGSTISRRIVLRN